MIVAKKEPIRAHLSVTEASMEASWIAIRTCPPASRSWWHQYWSRIVPMRTTPSRCETGASTTAERRNQSNASSVDVHRMPIRRSRLLFPIVITTLTHHERSQVKFIVRRLSKLITYRISFVIMTRARVEIVVIRSPHLLRHRMIEVKLCVLVKSYYLRLSRPD